MTADVRPKWKDRLSRSFLWGKARCWRLRITLSLNLETRNWLRNFPDSWVAKEEGSSFLSEFGGTWERLFIESAQPEIQDYFRELGVPEEHLPYVRPGERYRGSWVLEAAVVMAGTVGTAYTVLKGISELPDIADGLTKLKESSGSSRRVRTPASESSWLSRSHTSEQIAVRSVQRRSRRLTSRPSTW